MSRLPKGFCVLCVMMASVIGQSLTSVAQDEVADIRPEIVADIVADAVSPDGSFLVYKDWFSYPFNLALRHLDNGKQQPLTKENGGYTTGLAISPDGKTIAYGWNDGAFRLIGSDGNDVRTLIANPMISQIRSPTWSPEGKRIAAVLVSKDSSVARPVLIDAEDGTLEDLNLDGRVDNLIYSPDRKYLASFSSAEGAQTFANIKIYDLKAGKTNGVARIPNRSRLFGWTPKSDAIVYLRMLPDELEVWGQPIQDGKTMGEPKYLGIRIDASRLETSRMNVLGTTRKGDFFYSGESWINDVYLVDFDPLTGTLGRPKRVVKQVGYDTSAHFSPDGEHLSYAYGYGRRPRSMNIGIRTIENGKERRFPLEMLRFGGHAFQPHWSANGKSLLTQGRDKKMRMGLFEIDLQTEEITPLVQQTNRRRLEAITEWPSWSKDGTTFFATYTNNNNSPGPRRIVRLDANSDKQIEVYLPANPAAKVSHLAVSPDAEQLAFVESDFEAGQLALKVISIKGGPARELVRLPRLSENLYGQAVFALAWSLDSGSVLYVPPNDEKRKLVLWRVNIQNGDAKSLGALVEAPRAFGLSVHPGGRQIALTAGESRHGNVWALRGIE